MTSLQPGRGTSDSLASLLSRSWTVNRVTCGTITTWSSNDLVKTDEDLVVSLDLCLLGLIAANVLLFGPLLLTRAGLLERTGVDGLVAELQQRYDELLLPDSIDRLDGDLNTNVTFLESAIQSLLQSPPLKLLEDISRIFYRKSENSTEMEEGEEEEDDGYHEQTPSLQRQPVGVYKFPVGPADPSGLLFQGLETEVGQVLDISQATDPQKTAFYRLPRRREEAGGDLLPLLLSTLTRVVRIETL